MAWRISIADFRELQIEQDSGSVLHVSPRVRPGKEEIQRSARLNHSNRRQPHFLSSRMVSSHLQAVFDQNDFDVVASIGVDLHGRGLRQAFRSWNAARLLTVEFAGRAKRAANRESCGKDGWT